MSSNDVLDVFDVYLLLPQDLVHNFPALLYLQFQFPDRLSLRLADSSLPFPIVYLRLSLSFSLSLRLRLFYLFFLPSVSVPFLFSLLLSGSLFRFLFLLRIPLRGPLGRLLRTRCVVHYSLPLFRVVIGHHFLPPVFGILARNSWSSLILGDTGASTSTGFRTIHFYYCILKTNNSLCPVSVRPFFELLFFIIIIFNIYTLKLKVNIKLKCKWKIVVKKKFCH